MLAFTVMPHSRTNEAKPPWSKFSQPIESKKYPDIRNRNHKDDGKRLLQELNRTLVVKKMMAITTSRSRYWRLSFSPHDQLLLSDSAV